MKNSFLKFAPEILDIAALIYFWYQEKAKLESGTMVYLGNGVSLEHDGELAYKKVTELITVLPVLSPPDEKIQIRGKAGKPWKLIVDPFWIREFERGPADENAQFRPPASSKADSYCYLSDVMKIEKGYADKNPFGLYMDSKKAAIKETADVTGNTVFAFSENAEVNRIELRFPPSDEILITINKLWLQAKRLNIFETMKNIF